MDDELTTSTPVSNPNIHVKQEARATLTWFEGLRLLRAHIAERPEELKSEPVSYPELMKQSLESRSDWKYISSIDNAPVAIRRNYAVLTVAHL